MWYCSLRWKTNLKQLFVKELYACSKWRLISFSETQNQRSIWAGLSLTKKFMLISICIIGTVFLIMVGIYVTWQKESALVHLFRSKWKFGRSPRNDTSALWKNLRLKKIIVWRICLTCNFGMVTFEFWGINVIFV